MEKKCRCMCWMSKGDPCWCESEGDCCHCKEGASDKNPCRHIELYLRLGVMYQGRRER